MDDLMPMPRLSAEQLRALAVTVRSRAPGGDHVADSIAAALESVSRRREKRPLALAGDAAVSLLAGLARRGLQMIGSVCDMVAGPFMPARGMAPPRTPLRVVDVSRSTPQASASQWPAEVICSTLKDVEQGNGLLPEQCDALVVQGWAKWVDRTSGRPIGMNAAHSMLRLTPEGEDRLTCELIASTL